MGRPLPGVDVRLAGAVPGDDGTVVGELRVKGPSVFSRYWNRPAATAESFDADGYFITGDVASLNPEVRSTPMSATPVPAYPSPTPISALTIVNWSAYCADGRVHDLGPEQRRHHQGALPARLPRLLAWHSLTQWTQ